MENDQHIQSPRVAVLYSPSSVCSFPPTAIFPKVYCGAATPPAGTLTLNLTTRRCLCPDCNSISLARPQESRCVTVASPKRAIFASLASCISYTRSCTCVIVGVTITGYVSSHQHSVLAEFELTAAARANELRYWRKVVDWRDFEAEGEEKQHLICLWGPRECGHRGVLLLCGAV